MTVLAKDLLKFGKGQEKSGDEIGIRAGVSRSYYACYHALIDIVEGFPAYNPLDDHLTHREIVNRLTSWSVPESSPFFALRTIAFKIGKELQTAQANRVTADYKLGHTVSLNHLAEHNSRCERVIQSAALLNNGIGKIKATMPT